MIGFGERSTVLNRAKRAEDENDEMCYNEIFSEFEHFSPLHINQGYNISTCGHVFHTSCLDKLQANRRVAGNFAVFLTVSKKTENLKIRRSSHSTQKWLDIDEFTCMLCNRMYNLTIPIIPKRIHHEARRSESTPLKKQNRKLWEWLRECEYSIAPEKRVQKKTYVIKLGTLEVNKDDGGDESKDEKIDWNNEIKKVEAETESMEVESASNLDKV